MGLERHWLPGHHGHHHHHDHQHAHDHNYDQNQLCRPYHQNHRHHFRACCRHNHQHSCGLHRPRIIRRSLQHWAPPTQSLLRLEFAHFRSQICPAALLHVGNKPRPRLPTCFRVFVARACFLLHSSERLSVMARAIRAPRAEWRAEGLKALSNYWWAYMLEFACAGWWESPAYILVQSVTAAKLHIMTWTLALRLGIWKATFASCIGWILLTTLAPTTWDAFLSWDADGTNLSLRQTYLLTQHEGTQQVLPGPTSRQ